MDLLWTLNGPSRDVTLLFYCVLLLSPRNIAKLPWTNRGWPNIAHDPPWTFHGPRHGPYVDHTMDLFLYGTTYMCNCNLDSWHPHIWCLPSDAWSKSIQYQKKMFPVIYLDLCIKTYSGWTNLLKMCLNVFVTLLTCIIKLCIENVIFQ